MPPRRAPCRRSRCRRSYLLPLVAGVPGLRNRHREVALVDNRVAERRIRSPQPGDAERGGPHVDAAPASAEVERHADDVDRAQRWLLSAVFRFTDTDTPSPDGATIVVNRSGLRATVVEEIAHLVALVEHVVGEEEAAARQPRVHHVEGTSCSPRFHASRKTKSKLPWTFGISLKASPRTTVTTSSRPAVAMFAFASLGPLRVVLDGRQPAARFAQPQPNPDGAVSARGANLERPLAPLDATMQAQESAILLGNGQLALVGPPDLLQKPLQGRGQARGNGRLLAGDRGNRAQSTDEDQDTENLVIEPMSKGVQKTPRALKPIRM